MKRIALLLLCPAPLLGWLFIGNLFRGINAVQLIPLSGEPAHFLGYYWIAAVYGSALLLELTASVVLFAIASRRQKKAEPSEKC